VHRAVEQHLKVSRTDVAATPASYRSASPGVLLGTLVVGAALILCVARSTYPRDVATAMACEAFPAPLPASPAGYPSACPT